jgi:hypothetical protein
MPYRFEFDPEHRILLVVLEGNVGEREILTILKLRVANCAPTV